MGKIQYNIVAAGEGTIPYCVWSLHAISIALM